MKFYDALREMQENKAHCRVVGRPGKKYFWGDVMDVPCLKNSEGEEVLANSWIMQQDWEVINDLDRVVKITADEKLFNEWRDLGTRISGLAYSVQNDCEIPLADIQEWELTVDGTVGFMEVLKRRTSNHLRQGLK